MLLVQLVYTSRYITELSLDDARAIARKARDRNAGDDISGMLMFGHGHFLQVLEGGSNAVNGTYHRIALDPRHGDLRLLSYREVPERDFGAWGMRHVDATTIGPDSLLRFSRSTTFEPDQLTGAQALGLLRFTAKQALAPARAA